MEKVVNLNSLQNTGSGFAHSVKTTTTTTINRWYSYIIFMFNISFFRNNFWYYNTIYFC